MSNVEQISERKRKPRARHRDVVIGAIYERLLCIVGVENVEHTDRLKELLDELRRAVNTKETDE